MFSFHDTATTEIYPLSLHDALPISARSGRSARTAGRAWSSCCWASIWVRPRSEEHTSELQSRENLVCRLLLEKKKLQAIQTGKKFRVGNRRNIRANRNKLISGVERY